MKSKDCGFTLIELAVGMFIIALLLGSILVPLTTQVEQRQISETQKLTEEIREALVGYALANGYLPCPDAMSAAGTTPTAEINNGMEDVNAAGECQTRSGTAAVGNLPWATIGVGSKDAWGNRFRYVVAASFAQRSPALSFSTVTTTPLQVCENANCSPASTVLSNVAVAVVISHGNNGLGAMNATTSTQNLPLPTSPDELRNTSNDLNKVSRIKSNVTGSEFDDIVTTLSRFTLIDRMIAAKKLP